MDLDIANLAYVASTWVLPLVLAITLHEAAHGYIARLRGDNTAWLQGRVTLNPLKHIDPFGTILFPALLLVLRAPFLFGYAKPVPVDFRALRNPRTDMALVALAGPAINIVMALIAGLLIHTVVYLPKEPALWCLANLENAILINVALAVFNMIPLPPLDGGRVAVGLLPNFLAVPLSRLEPHGMTILLGLIIFLPLIGSQIGKDLDVLGWFLGPVNRAVLKFVAQITGIA